MNTKVSQESVIFNIKSIFSYSWTNQNYTNGYKKDSEILNPLIWFWAHDKKGVLIGVISFTPINLLLFVCSGKMPTF